MHQQDSLHDELLAEVDSIAPILAKHAPESEKLGRLNTPSIEAVRGTRLLRILAPRELGGLEVDPVTYTLILEALARIDGSMGWTIGILGSSVFPGAYLTLTAARRIFAKSVPPMAASLLPKGQAEPVAGGYRVNGRWPFASGIHHAEWVSASAFVPGRPEPEGLRVVVLSHPSKFLSRTTGGLRVYGAPAVAISRLRARWFPKR